MTPLSRRTWRVRALAKINLSLRILGTHADGYHELRTTFQSVALHDTLVFTATRGPLILTCDDPACPTDEGNLVWRAAERLWRADKRPGRPAGVTVGINKRIPMQAGLGGGSSDAAAALRGLARLWRTQVADATLHAIARGLGADVAYFLEGGTVLGVGRGEILYPLADRPAVWVVLIRPAFGVSTKEAYGWWDAIHPKGLVSSKPQPSRLGGGEIGNDLQAPVTAHHPEVGKIVKRLLSLGAVQSGMSGSGSAVFGLFPERSGARAAAAALGGAGRLVTVTRTVSRREYRTRTAPI